MTAFEKFEAVTLLGPVENNFERPEVLLTCGRKHRTKLFCVFYLWCLLEPYFQFYIEFSIE